MKIDVEISWVSLPYFAPPFVSVIPKASRIWNISQSKLIFFYLLKVFDASFIAEIKRGCQCRLENLSMDKKKNFKFTMTSRNGKLLIFFFLSRDFPEQGQFFFYSLQHLLLNHCGRKLEFCWCSTHTKDNFKLK